MVKTGIVGLGPVWETRYRPALFKLRDRIAVRAVYDPIASCAEQAAAELGASAVEGIVPVLERPDIEAVLLLDSGWYSAEALRLVCRYNKPAFIAQPLATEPAKVRDLFDTAALEGLTLMPEFGRRYTPATGRLRELIATKLGKPHRIVVDLHASHAEHGHVSGEDVVGRMLDWCYDVVSRPPVSLRTHAVAVQGTGNGQLRTVTLEFQKKSGDRNAVAEVHLHEGENAAAESSAPGATATAPPMRMTYRLECERGNALLTSETEIHWSADSGERHETLSAERSDVEVMLDHFCRRVIGGLVPVADFADVVRCVRLSQAANESFRTGQTVLINGSGQ